MEEKELFPNDDELKELFSLFTSTTLHERNQVYDPLSIHFFLNQNLLEEYSLTEEKREYALDAWRSVMYFLHKNGFSLCKGGRKISLAFIEGYFIQ